MTEQTTHPTTKVARDLTEIINLHASLLDHAVDAERARPLTGLPGGGAMVALGNVANVEAWDNHQQATERYGRAYTSVADEDPDEAWSAFQLLEFWSERWRAAHGAEYGKRPTIVTEANFIRWALDWAWDHEHYWDEFAADVRRARLHLEDILSDGKRADLTRVLCNNPTCERPSRLMLLMGEGEDQDRWKCPACKTRYDHDDFRRARASMFRHADAARFVPLPDALGVLRDIGRGERTIRRWLEPPIEHIADECSECGREWQPTEHNACPGLVFGQGQTEACGGELVAMTKGDPDAVVESYCDLATHRVHVWWPDLWRLHLTTETRRRGSAS